MSKQSHKLAPEITAALAELPVDLDELLTAGDEYLNNSTAKLAERVQGRLGYVAVGSFDRQVDTEVVRLVALYQLLRQKGNRDLMRAVESQLLWLTERKFPDHPGHNLVLCRDLTVIASLFRVVRGRVVWPQR